MFDESKIGQSFVPFTYEVQRNKIHELTSAVGDTNPIYHSREAARETGFPDVPISPTTPTMFSFWGNQQRGSSLAEVGINVSLILHGEEEYEYIAPIYPVNLGDDIPALTAAPVTHLQLVRYAGASGDFNPLHTDPKIGEMIGTGGIIAHGMLIMGFVGQMLSDYVGPQALRKFGVQSQRHLCRCFAGPQCLIFLV
jgi:acyl dehydratase